MKFPKLKFWIEHHPMIIHLFAYSVIFLTIFLLYQINKTQDEKLTKNEIIIRAALENDPCGQRPVPIKQCIVQLQGLVELITPAQACIIIESAGLTNPKCKDIIAEADLQNNESNPAEGEPPSNNTPTETPSEGAGGSDIPQGDSDTPATENPPDEPTNPPTTDTENPPNNPPSNPSPNNPVNEVLDGANDIIDGTQDTINETTCNLSPALC